MKYGTVPHFDKQISRLVMGVIPLPQNDNEKAFALLDTYRAAGGNIIDNSYHYGPGFSVVMKAYYEARGEDALIRFDKGSHHYYGRENWNRTTREAMDEEIRGNLERQGVSYSDFYVLHRDNEAVPAGEVVEWLNAHKDAGRIKAFGGSNWSAARIAEANEYAEKHGLQGFSASSPNLSLALANEPMWTGCSQPTREERAWYATQPVGLFSWSSGGGGFFAHLDEVPDIIRVYHNEINFARRERVGQMAAEKGVTGTQLALAWTLNQPINVFGLIGPRTVEQLEDNLKAVDIELTPEELTWLEDGPVA
ncbi:Tas Predicted oxidoreductases (related to aryl-alcohol dehydrogenases) [Fimbriimonadaceae bacterium]